MRASRLSVIALMGYLAMATFAHLSAQSVLFQPHYGSRRTVEGAVKFRAEDGTELVGLHLPNPKARFTLWYFHGNAEDLGDLEPYLRQLREAGFAVFAFDYPGYGLSGGKPSEKSLYSATRAAHAYLRDTLGVRSGQLLLYGRSVGSGPAVELATRKDVSGVILDGALISVYRVATKWRVLPFDKFENLRKISRLRCPVLVIHGRADRVIPFYHGEKLFAAAHPPKQHLWVDGAGHNDLLSHAGQRYWQALREFEETCAKSAVNAGRR